jgi:hypothetical protein
MLGEAVSTAASAVAIAGTGLALVQWVRARRARGRLGQWARKLHRFDRRVVACVGELDAVFDEGPGWAGWAIWPDSLRDMLAYLDDTIDQLERASAELRAIDAPGAVERLRVDVEQMATVLRLAAVTYRAGAIESYRESSGEAIPMGATGREPTPVLGSNSTAELGALRDEFTLLARTVADRLGDEEHAEKYRAVWPIARAECLRDAWGSEPRPPT